ncbi:SRPBCC family protein [Kocuria sp. M1R5S2]|uniref:SRPBCC family protein n=1 Tax=Kocuria rhizosphaerae TaxID=3376285 RepID=UPI00379D5FAE
MTTQVEKSIVVDVPVSTVYNQWTQFEDFPRFMKGVERVTQLADDRLEWVAEIGGVRRRWEARILEQVPDRRIAWAAAEGATNAGAVSFQDAGNGRTAVALVLEYEPEGLVEKAGDALDVVEKQAEGDLRRFKEFIEDEGYATGAWRGSVDEGVPAGTPGVERAASSRGDDGGAGVSGKAVAAGVAAAGAAVAGVAAAAKRRDADRDADRDAGRDARGDTGEATGPVTAAAAPTATPVAPETPVPGPVPPITETDPALVDDAVAADVDVDPTTRHLGDGRSTGGAL